MATWTITPTMKKSIIERNYFHKDGNTFIVETGWRWGEFTCETEDDEPPVLEEGVDLYACEYEVELVETTDGCWETYDMDGCDAETVDWLEQFLDENSYLDLEERGWIAGDTEMIIDCEMDIEKDGD